MNRATWIRATPEWVSALITGSHLSQLMSNLRLSQWLKEVHLGRYEALQQCLMSPDFLFQSFFWQICYILMLPFSPQKVITSILFIYFSFTMALTRCYTQCSVWINPNHLIFWCILYIYFGERWTGDNKQPLKVQDVIKRINIYVFVHFTRTLHID